MALKPPDLDESTIEADVLIIGAGLAGLTCAIGLRDSGLRVVVAEREGTLGGRARTWCDEVTGDPVDMGPHIFLSEYPNTLSLLGVLGTRERIVWHTDEFISMVDGRHRVVMRMSRLPPPFHFIPSVFSDRTVSLLDKLSNLRASLRAMQMDEKCTVEIDEIDAYSYLRSLGVTEGYINRFWRFVSMAIMNVPIEDCSAGAIMRFYRHLIGHSNFHIGFPSSGLSSMFAEQAREILDRAGVGFLMKTEVKTLTAEAGRISGAKMVNGMKVVARFCVAAIPPQDLFAAAPREWIERHTVFGDLSSFQPCPYISTFTWWDRKLTNLRFWARLWSPQGLNLDFYDLSNINEGWGPRPSVIASNIVYSHRANHLSDDEVVNATVRELSEFIPAVGQARILHSVVNRIPMAISCPHPGTERKRPATETPIQGLFLAGDWTRTGVPSSMESAVRSGWLAAERVLGATNQPQKLAIEMRETGGLPGIVRSLSTAVRESIHFDRREPFQKRGRIEFDTRSDGAV